MPEELTLDEYQRRYVKRRPGALANLPPGTVMDASEYLKLLEAEKAPKFGNNPFWLDGQYWHSEGEHDHWLVLQARQAAGEISGLRRQVEFPLNVNGVSIGSYTADYVWQEDGRQVVADFKSRFTVKLREWRRTKKLMLACHGIRVREIVKGECQ